MTEKLPILKFAPVFVDKLWGGSRLRDVLAKDCSDRCGESWEISGVEGSISVVSEGPLTGKDLRELIRENRGKLVGNAVFEEYGDEFPLLIKFIDANDDLSVQVHPDDQMAMERHGTRGKTEMWYVIDSEKDATLIAGLEEGTDKKKYLEYFESGKIMDVLKSERVSPGDTFFIPAGLVHTIGKGILLAEVQETSDITYRIYDFDRIDMNGKKRDLHIDESLDAINYDDIPSRVDYDKNSKGINLATCPYFTTNRVTIDQSHSYDYTNLDSFVIYICFDGTMEVKSGKSKTQLKKGETVLIPADTAETELIPDEVCSFLEVYIGEK